MGDGDTGICAGEVGEVGRLRLDPGRCSQCSQACGCLVTWMGTGNMQSEGHHWRTRGTSQVKTRKFNQGGADKSAVSNCLGWQEKEGWSS